MWHLYVCIVVILLHCTSVHTSRYGTAQQDAYPNPMTDARGCGMSRPGWVCDPDGLINQAEADDINSELKKLHQLPNVCICEHCPSSVGLGVAFVRKVEFQYERTKKTRAEQKQFAVYSLTSTLRIHKWTFLKGECLNSGVILITGDREVEFQIGRDASYKVEWNCESEIESVGKKLVSSGKYYEGAMEMAKKLRNILETGDKCEKEYGSSSTISFLPIIVVLVIIVLCAIICMVIVRARRSRMMQQQQQAQGGATYHTVQGAQVVVAAPPQPYNPGGMGAPPQNYNPGGMGAPPQPYYPGGMGAPPQHYNPGGMGAPPPSYPSINSGGQAVYGQPPLSYNPDFATSKEYGKV